MVILPNCACCDVEPTTCNEWRQIPSSGSEKVAIKFSGLPNLIPCADFSSYPTNLNSSIPDYAYACGWRDLAFFNYYPIALYYAGICEYYSTETQGTFTYGSPTTPGWEVSVSAPLSGGSSTTIVAKLGLGACIITIEIDGFIKWDTDYTVAHPDVISWSAVTCDGQAVTSTGLITPSVSLDISAVTVRLMSSAPSLCYRPCNQEADSYRPDYINNLSLDGVSSSTSSVVLLPPACESFANADCVTPSYSGAYVPYGFSRAAAFSEDQVDFTLSSMSWERWCSGGWDPWGETIPAGVLTTYTLDWMIARGGGLSGTNYTPMSGWGWGLMWTDLPGGVSFGGVDFQTVNQIAIFLSFPARVTTLNGPPTVTSATRNSQLTVAFRNKYTSFYIYGGVLMDQDAYSCKSLVSRSGTNSVSPDNGNGVKNTRACGLTPLSFAPTNYRPTFSWSVVQA